MSGRITCACKNPSTVQRAEGLYCVTCCKYVESGDEKRDNIRAEIRRIELEIRTLNRRVQDLKQQAGL